MIEQRLRYSSFLGNYRMKTRLSAAIYYIIQVAKVRSLSFKLVLSLAKVGIT
jgi:hypothetical protein